MMIAVLSYLPSIFESPVSTKRAEFTTSNLELSRSFIVDGRFIYHKPLNSNN